MKRAGHFFLSRTHRFSTPPPSPRNQAGFSLIELLIVVALIGIITAIAIPSLVAARKSANKASAVQSLRVYYSAQMTYQNGRAFLADFQLLKQRTDGIDDILGRQPNNIIKSGYVFEITPGVFPAEPALSTPISGLPDTAYPAFCIQANPVQLSGVGSTGHSSYYIDHSGVIRVRFGALDADSTDPPLPSESGF